LNRFIRYWWNRFFNEFWSLVLIQDVSKQWYFHRLISLYLFQALWFWASHSRQIVQVHGIQEQQYVVLRHGSRVSRARARDNLWFSSEEARLDRWGSLNPGTQTEKQR
jgi:hypothetical protein